MSRKHRESHRRLTRMMKGRSAKAGMPPGSLVHIGEGPKGPVRLRLLVYGPDGVSERDATEAEALEATRSGAGTAWVRVEGVHDVEVVRRLGEAFGLHPLVQEDILNTDQRPKVEDYGGYLYIVVKTLTPPAPGEPVVPEQVSLVLGNGWLLSFTERPSDLFDPVLARVRSEAGRHRKHGADYLAYTLLDAAVDRFFAGLEATGETAEQLEEEVVADPGPDVLARIHRLKRDLIFLRKAVWPLREVVSGLGRQEEDLVTDATRLYLRDVYDHVVQVIDIVETLRDMASGMLDIYLSSVSNRMNQVMKVLTVIATIFIPLTFVTSLYGMNFKFMPELDWRWGYPAVLGFMLVIALAMLLFFKRRRWL